MKRLLVAVATSFLFTAIVTTLVDHAFHLTNIYPPYGEPFKKTGLLVMTFAYRVQITREEVQCFRSYLISKTFDNQP